MENKRAILWSIVAAVAAALFYYLSVEKAVHNRVGDRDETVQVVAAIQDLEPGTRIEGRMIKRIAWPKNFVPPNTAITEQEVVGQVAQSTIKANEPIMTTKLIPFDESSLERRIPEGKRAVTIGIRDPQDVIGVAGLLRPGNFVDILLTLYVSTKEIERSGLSEAAAAVLNQQANNLKAEVRTIFQRVQIIAVRQDLRLPSAQVSRATSMAGRAEPEDKNVTVAMTPQEVQKLVLAQQIGRITLVLRPFGDTATIDDLDYLDPFKAFGIKLPIVVGPPPSYREIRGGVVFDASATPF